MTPLDSKRDKAALTRYVAAWVKREEAHRQLVHRTEEMRAFEAQARRELRQGVGWEVIELGNGRKFNVFADTAGVVVFEEPPS